MRVRVVVGAAAAASLVAAVAVWAWQRVGSSSGLAALTPPVFQLRPDSSRAYELSFTTRVTSSGASPRETTLVGRLNVRVVSSGSGPALAAQLDPVEVKVDGAAQPDMSRRYSTPFVVPITPSGRFGAALFPSELAKGDRAALDGVIRSFQVVLPAAPRETWEATETDQVGTLVATYRRGTVPTAIHKTKLRYTAMPPPALFTVRVLASAVHAGLDTDGPWLARIEGAEELVLAPVSGGPAARVEARFSLEPAGAPTDATAAGLLQAATAARVGVDAGASAPSAWDEAERAAARQRLQAGRVTLAGLTARAQSAELPAPALTHEIVAFLRAYPEAAAEVPRSLEGLGDAPAAILMHALELADTPEAQSALLDVAGGGGHSRANRIRALIALGGVETPGHDTLERLEREAREAGAGDRSGVASTALLALGQLATRAPEGEGQRIVSELAGSLRTTNDRRRERLLLLALENARAPLTADELAPHLASGDAQVREAAARVAGYATGGDATAALVELLGREPAAPVREAALAGLLLRPADPQANAAIVAALTGGREPDAAVRARMVAYLARQFPAFPANRDLLRQYVPREPSRDVTVAILNAIAR